MNKTLQILFSLLFVFASGKAQQNNTAALSSLFAYNGIYNRIAVKGETLPAGVMSGFNDTYIKLVSDFNSSTKIRSSASIIQMSFVLRSNSDARLMIGFTMTNDTKEKKTAFLAAIDYDYTISQDIITFSAGSPNITWRNRAVEVAPLNKYFNGKSFKIDWVLDVSGNKTLGGLYPIDAPGNFFYGKLSKVKPITKIE